MSVIGIGIGIPFEKNASDGGESLFTMLTFDDIVNVPVADASDVDDWNTWFDLPTNGTPYNSVSVNSNTIILSGGSNITLTSYLFGDNVCGPHLISIIDNGCIIDPGEGSFSDYGTNGYGCKNMTTAVFPAITTLNYWPFYNCVLLNAFNIPSTITDIGDYCFTSCNISEINIPGGVTNIGVSAFSDNELKEIIIPDSVTTLGEYCFEWNEELEYLHIGSGVTNIPNNAFYYSHSSPELIIPDTVITIGDHAFDFWESMITCTIGNGVTTTGELSFDHAEHLETLNIGSGITTIGSQSFYRAPYLSTVNIYASTAPTVLGDVSLSFPHTGSVLHVPVGSTGYDVAPWTNTEIFASIVQDL